MFSQSYNSSESIKRAASRMVNPIEKDSAMTGSERQYLTLASSYANSSGAKSTKIYLNRFFIDDKVIYSNW